MIITTCDGKLNIQLDLYELPYLGSVLQRGINEIHKMELPKEEKEKTFVFAGKLNEYIGNYFNEQTNNAVERDITFFNDEFIEIKEDTGEKNGSSN